MTDADMTSAVKKLERKVVTEKNLSHVKRLLNQKLTVRRQWIENESDGINAIVKKYPPLQHYEMILYELLNMRIITEDRLFEKINFTMKILLKYCGLKEDNKTSKVQVLKHLNNLAHKKIKKKQTTLFTVKKILFEENININIVKSHDKESVNNQCMKDQHKFTTERSGCINFPTTFSALTYDLEQKLKTDGILKAQRYFISFWGQYLWQETHTKPTKLDYSNLAQSIVTAYPKLSGVRNGCFLFY
ncbi:uncharacterized protein [Cardiocondyla obscurior]|uniref:uncharacterized protein n=2 Tax=Cardiocondyla obscurior TaxID=286306 RepID=UPI0039658401